MDAAAGIFSWADAGTIARATRKRRRSIAIQWWPCWTVAPALFVALLVFVPWYMLRLAPDYALAGRAQHAPCLVLAHDEYIPLEGGNSGRLVMPRLYVRLCTGKAHSDYHYNKDNASMALDGAQVWASPFFLERDSYMTESGALVFLATLPVSARATCFYDPVAPTRRVAMSDAMPSLFQRLCLAAWSAGIAAVSAMALCFGLVWRWVAP